MPKDRIFFTQGGKVYHFATVEQRPDASVYIAVPRKNAKGRQHWSYELDDYVEGSDDEIANRKISYHTTGRVNFGDLVKSEPTYYEPLFDIKRRNFFFHYSIPSVGKLDSVEVTAAMAAKPTNHFVEIPEAAVARSSFSFGVVPLDDLAEDLGWKIRRTYGLFALVIVQAIVQGKVIAKAPEHFIYGAVPRDHAGAPVHKYAAELAYHQKLAGAEQELVIYQPDAEGYYTLYPAVVMARVPSLLIKFTREGLETVLAENNAPHKVRFRIRGKAGFITDADIRPLISEMELSAEL